MSSLTGERPASLSKASRQPLDRLPAAAEYIIHNSGHELVVRQLTYSTKQITSRPDRSPPKGRYKVFVTHNFDDTARLVLNCIREMAETENVELMDSLPGGAAKNPAEDVRDQLERAEALLAVVRQDTSWVSNEIGMAYALHIPVYVICERDVDVRGLTPLITSHKSANVTERESLCRACTEGFRSLKRAIDDQREKLPEPIHDGSTVSKVPWWEYFKLVKAARARLDVDRGRHGGFPPTLVLGISRGGIIVADILSRLSSDRSLRLIEAKRRSQPDEVLFEETPLRALLRSHCDFCAKTRSSVRILANERH